MSTTDIQGWTTVRLGDIGQCLIGLTYSPDAVKRSGTLVLRSSNIQDGRLVFDDNVYVNSVIPNRIRVRENDILICARNGSRQLIGKSVMLDHRVIGQTFGAFMAVYRSSFNRYLQYFFQSGDFKRQIEDHLGATINQITNASLNSFLVALPSPAEQEAIVSRLTDVDRYIVALERLITKKQAIKHGMMQQLLTGKTRFSGYANPWLDVRLGEISASITKGATPTTYGFAWESSGIPFLRSECVSERGLDMRQSMFISPAAHQALRRSKVVDGDILMTITGYVGRVIRLAGIGEVNINQHIARVRIKDNRFDPGYVYHYLSQPSMREYYESIITGQAYPQISLAQVRNTNIPAIPFDEQQAIAAALDDADGEMNLLRQRHAKAQHVKQGLMQQLLTGRTRLPTEEGAA